MVSIPFGTVDNKYYDGTVLSIYRIRPHIPMPITALVADKTAVSTFQFRLNLKYAMIVYLGIILSTVVKSR